MKRDPLLQELADRRDIEHVITPYARAIDRLDIELLKSLYHGERTTTAGLRQHCH
jgi:SnoaL-like domain